MALAKRFHLHRHSDGTVTHDGPWPTEMILPMGWFESGGIEGVLKEKADIEAALASGNLASLNLSGNLANKVTAGVLSGRAVADVLTDHVSSMNLVPFFTRDGMDMLFNTVAEADGEPVDYEVKYKFVGFATDEVTGKLNPDAPMFKLVHFEPAGSSSVEG
jgi:hypothetical protein